MVIDSSDDEDFECTSETTPEIRDIDTDSSIFYVSEYASEIFQYLKQAEVLLFKFIIGSNKVIRKLNLELSKLIHFFRHAKSAMKTV